jgi:glycosyltransferase involved in cell wall biosynthesis
MEVNVAYYTEDHLHPESGLDRVLQGLIDRVSVLRYLEPCLPRRMPPWLMRRLAPPLGKHPRMSFYEPSALRLEYAVMRHLVTAPGQVVHMFQGDPHFNYTAWLRHWPRRRRGALVVSFFQPPGMFERVWRFKRKRVRLGAIDEIVVVSTPQLEYFRDLVGDDKVTLVPLGTNRRVFNPPATRPVREDVRCIMVGDWLRDSVLLRQAIERVTAASDRVSFSVLSTPRFLERLGHPPRTTTAHGVTGHALVAAYHDADLFVHPVTDASGNTALLEAMSCGLPVVATDVGGVRDYTDATCAELVSPDDPDAMADSILRLASDPERRERMGASAEQRTRTLDWPYMAANLVPVYRRALERRR